MEKTQILEIRQKIGEYRTAMSNVVRSFNKHQNFPQEAKDNIVNEQTKLDEAIEILDEMLNKMDEEKSELTATNNIA